MYRFFRYFFFLLDAEQAHYLAMDLLKTACSIGFVRTLLSKAFAPPILLQHVLGLTFKNPIGLGAGFDKNAKYLRELEVLGFGFIEIGTVTPRPQAGNEKPRLFRLPKDKALINRMGFNNDGVEVIAKRLMKWRSHSSQLDSPSEQKENSKLKTQNPKLIIGGNIGKNKTTPNEEAWKDYEICFKALHPYVDFFVVNVSSPNTPGLRALQEKDTLRRILTHLQMLNETFIIQKPILLKIAPDLTQDQLIDVVELVTEIKLDGLVATNTTISREQLHTSVKQVEVIGAGGLSGKPLAQRATEVIHFLYQRTQGSIPIIGSGGIFTGADAQQKRKAGAALIEVWTGLIYEGPDIVKTICRQLQGSW
ncbi:MAG: quinone-dependent dihydroorotate dehydrogenase [Bacteroidota bacterium]|nr:quinone-dependent dihydroorotate dehydrogenase [Bacteroidota bacterium]